jgi:hypothetical protein
MFTRYVTAGVGEQVVVNFASDKLGRDTYPAHVVGLNKPQLVLVVDQVNDNDLWAPAPVEGAAPAPVKEPRATVYRLIGDELTYLATFNKVSDARAYVEAVK